MTIIETLETDGRKAFTWVQRSGLRLLGEAAKAGAYLQDLYSEHKLVRMVVDTGVAEAEAHGVPVETIEDAGEKVIAAAKEIAAELAATPAVPPALSMTDGKPAVPAAPSTTTNDPGASSTAAPGQIAEHIG